MNEVFDQTDLDILYELDRNCRRSAKEIGKHVNLGPSAVNYRINKLHDEHAVKKYITVVDQSKLGNNYYRLHLRLQNPTVDEEHELINALTQHDHVHWLISTEGRFNILAGFIAASNHAFYTILNDVLEHHGDIIRDHAIATPVVAPEYPRSYLTKESTSRVTYLQSRSDTVELDDVEHAILQTISHHARMNTVDIAKAIDETPTVVNYRLNKLRDANVIQSFRTQINHAPLGLRYYKTIFHISHMTDDLQEQLLQFGTAHDHVVYMFFCLGAWNFEINTEVWTHDEYRTVLNAFKESFGDRIDEYETLLVTDEHTIDYYPH